MSARALALLAAVRIAIPLAALAASGTTLPLLPRYEYEPLRGDAPGYLATARELLAGWRRLGPWGVLLALLALATVVAAARLWRRRPAWRPWLAVAVALAFAIAFAAAVARMETSPVVGIGWPLLWSVPLAPLRVIGVTGEDPAFAAGLAISLAAHAVAVVAIGYAGLYASGRRAVAYLAAAAYALWPVLSGLLGGAGASRNYTWAVESGLAMFTEPVSTACVAVGTALVLSPERSRLRLALAGLALGYASVVRPTNALIAAVALLFVAARRGTRGMAPYTAGLAAFTPLVLAFEPKNEAYESRTLGVFGTGRVLDNWLDSHQWNPRALAVLVPLAVVGGFSLPPRVAAFLAGSFLALAALYSFFELTAEHPRYLLAGLPALLVLVAAGLDRLGKEFVRIGAPARSRG